MKLVVSDCRQKGSRIDEHLPFRYYDEVKGLYKEAEWGNPRIDPVVLFKIVFIQYLYGIRSMSHFFKIISAYLDLFIKL